MRVSGLKPGRYQVRIRRTGYRENDAYTAYLEMGRPEKLSPGQLQQLQAVTKDAPRVHIIEVKRDGSAALTLPMRAHDVVLVELYRG